MVNMYSVVESLCERQSISIAQMCRDIGIRQGLISDLKHGRSKSLSAENMLRIANYFQVSTDVFHDGVYEETLPNAADYSFIAGKSQHKKEIPASPKTDGDRKRAYEMLNDLSPEDLDLVAAFVQGLKSKKKPD